MWFEQDLFCKWNRLGRKTCIFYPVSSQFYPWKGIKFSTSSGVRMKLRCSWANWWHLNLNLGRAEIQMKNYEKPNSRINWQRKTFQKKKTTFCSPDFLLIFFVPSVLKSPRDLCCYQGKSSLNSLGVKLIKIDLKWQRWWHLPADRRRVLPATGFSSSQFWKTILLWTFSDFPKFKNCETLIRII